MAQPTTTRRALLSAATATLAYAGGAAIAGAGLVIATEARSEPVEVEKAQDPQSLPLAPFVLTWLAQWSDAGGAVMPSHEGDGTYWFGWPEYDLTAHWKKLQHDNAGWSDERRDRNYRWGDATYHGKMRALLDLLNAVPGAVDTAKALIASNRRLGWSVEMKEAHA